MSKSMITISMAGKGGGVAPTPVVNTIDEEADVIFVDYDGKIVASYSFSEISQLTTLPTPPSHSGLVFQEWNWTLAEIKSINAPAVIGAHYVTSDGKSRVYVSTIWDNYSVSLWINQTVSEGALVDWGDGTSGSIQGTGDVNLTHTYATKGDYVIKISTISGVVSIGSKGTWNYGHPIIDANIFVKFEQGNHALNFGCFRDCFRVGSISFSTNGFNTASRRMFYNCKHLSCIVINRSLTSLDTETFDECSLLKYMSLPIETTKVDGCTGLSSLRRYNGHKATVKYGPKSNLALLILNDGLVRIGNSTGNGYQLQGDVAVLPDSLTTIDSYALYNIYGVKKLVIGKGVTTIPNFVCQNSLLLEIEIGENVTSIGSNSFYNCSKLVRIRFNSTIPPTIASTSVFQHKQASCVISVPTGCLDAYKTATNYPNPETYTYIEED